MPGDPFVMPVSGGNGGTRRGGLTGVESARTWHELISVLIYLIPINASAMPATALAAALSLSLLISLSSLVCLSHSRMHQAAAGWRGRSRVSNSAFLFCKYAGLSTCGYTRRG